MTMDGCFIDTNILLRLILYDIPDDQSPRVEAYFGLIAQGEIGAWISDTVIFETVYILEKNHRIERARISDTMLDILGTPGIQYLGVANMDDVFALYMSHGSLSIADCLHASLARRLPEPRILSFDRGFDRVPGLQRIEPPALPIDQ